ncbi:MAG: hypothetical protein JNM57_06785 [Cyclobacteriaceae bacterium]|nr:hypothetical protein [Cyclobacteriaceae bacterium]
MRTMFLWISLVFMLASCASSYKPLDPQNFSYDRSFVRDSVVFSYRYHIQGAVRNTRYEKRELKYGMKAVALKIENLSSKPVVLSENNLDVMINDQVKPLLSPSDYAKEVKQRVGIHLLHALWGPWAISWQEDANGETDVDFIYIPVGAIVGIANAGTAAKANKNNLANLENFSVQNHFVRSGGTLYGIIIIPTVSDESLTFRIRDETEK